MLDEEKCNSLEPKDWLMVRLFPLEITDGATTTLPVKFHAGG